MKISSFIIILAMATSLQAQWKPQERLAHVEFDVCSVTMEVTGILTRSPKLRWLSDGPQHLGWRERYDPIAFNISFRACYLRE